MSNKQEKRGAEFEDNVEALTLEVLQSRVTFRLAHLQARLNAQASRLLREKAGLTLMQWRVMSVIARNGSTTHGALVRVTVFDKGLLSRTVQNLTEAGLVAAERDKNDLRSVQLTLTEEGRRRFAAAMPHMRRRHDQLLEGLAPSERAALFTILDKLDEAARK